MRRAQEAPEHEQTTSYVMIEKQRSRASITRIFLANNSPRYEQARALRQDSVTQSKVNCSLRRDSGLSITDTTDGMTLLKESAQIYCCSIISSPSPPAIICCS